MPLKGKRPNLAWKVIAAILVGVGLHIVLVHLPQSIQKHYGDLFRAAIVLIVGGVISWALEAWLNGSAREWLGAHRAASFRFMTRLVLYLSVALALLAAFGVGLSSVVFGSAFLTVILGLAGQNFFANLIAGIGLIFYRPFEVGDRVSFVAWQFGVLMPSFPHERMKPTYSGTVRDVSLAYTTLETDEGLSMKVPNGILIQAYIENHRQAVGSPFRFRFDLDLALDPNILMPRLEDQLKSLQFSARVALADVGAATFAILLTGHTTESEDVARHAILRRLIPLVQELRGTTTAQPN